MRQYVRERLGDSSGKEKWMAQNKITGKLVSSVFSTLFNLQLPLTIRTIKHKEKKRGTTTMMF